MSLLISFVHAEDSGRGAVYKLGAEDVIKISIRAGGEEQVEKEMVVGENGTLNVPFVGRIKAAGLTIDALEKAIMEPLERDFFVNPQIHLQIAEYHSLQFFISGAVKNPGLYELNFTPTIMDLIAKAGGVLPQRGNIAYIIKSSAKRQMSKSEMAKAVSGATEFALKIEPVTVDLKSLLDEGDMSENIRLESGDSIYVPLEAKLNQAATKVYVQGEVKRPGVFDYQPGMTAMGACIMAGGFDKFAAPNRTKIIRQTKAGQKIIKINLKKVEKGEIEDIFLKPGDRIHIPESWM